MTDKSTFPYQFDSNACKSCNGKCCRGFEGYVWISETEFKKIAGMKGMDITSFSRQYVRRVKGRLSLKERMVNGEYLCCFFDPIDCKCTIYQCRPKQCRTFPFWNQFKKNPRELFVDCPGVILK